MPPLPFPRVPLKITQISLRPSLEETWLLVFSESDPACIRCSFCCHLSQPKQRATPIEESLREPLRVNIFSCYPSLCAAFSHKREDPTDSCLNDTMDHGILCSLRQASPARSNFQGCSEPSRMAKLVDHGVRLLHVAKLYQVRKTR